MTVNPDTIARDNPDIEDLVNEHLGDRAQANGDASGDTDSTGGKNTEATGSEKKEKRESQADLLVKIIEDSGAEFFHTPTDEQLISFPIGDHDETWPIRSRSSRRWITSKFYRTTKKAPNSEAMHRR